MSVTEFSGNAGSLHGRRSEHNEAPWRKGERNSRREEAADRRPPATSARQRGELQSRERVAVQDGEGWDQIAQVEGWGGGLAGPWKGQAGARRPSPPPPPLPSPYRGFGRGECVSVCGFFFFFECYVWLGAALASPRHRARKVGRPSGVSLLPVRSFFNLLIF